MIFQKKLVSTILKFVLPEVVKLIKPLRKYVEEPNELDELCKELERKTQATNDILVDVGKNVHEVEEHINTIEKTVKADFSKVAENMKDLKAINSRLITLQAMVDKFDRDQDYFEQKIKDISTIVTTLTKLKGK